MEIKKITINELKKGIVAFKVLTLLGLCKSNSEARRLIAQGGSYIGPRNNKFRIPKFDYLINEEHLNKERNEIIIWAGKKRAGIINVVND